MNTNGASGFKMFLVFLLIGIIAFGLLTSCSSGSGSRSSSSGSTNTCKVCGRSWPAGDSGGNFMKIARTNMCVNCYNNYKTGMAATGRDVNGNPLGGK